MPTVLIAGRREVRVAALCVVALLLGVADLTLIADAPRLPTGGAAVPVLLAVVGWGYVAVGSFAWLRRADNPTGVLMVAAGFVMLLNGLGLSRTPLVALFGALTDTLTVTVIAHLLVAFPSGRLEERRARVAVAVAYFAATVLQLPAVLLDEHMGTFGCDGCPANPIFVASAPALLGALHTVQALLLVGLLIGAVVAVVRRWRTAGGVQRRTVAPLLGVGTAILVLTLCWGAVQALHAPAGWQKATQIVFVSTAALLPWAFLAGLVRTRFFRAAAVHRLLERLTRQPDARGLTEALAAALRDPTLAIAYWLPERHEHVDHEGHAVRLPAPGSGRRATPILVGDRRVGALVHDDVLLDDPALLREASGAAALALENARLEVELRARLEDLRASRARLVETADAERRRLTRDLHDGAQQRLVSLLLQLQLAGERWDDEPALARELVGQAQDNARAAIAELRELAAGIHPAVLSQRGLDAALESLAVRAAVPVELDARIADRLPAPVESAAYFVVAEALTNVAKYARATHARVSAHVDDGAAIVEVRDDGVGGADAARGTGLRGLADRVGAIDGTLEVDSAPGAGTAVRARLPLAA